MRFPPLRVLLISIYVGISAYACSQLGDEPVIDPDPDPTQLATLCVIDVPDGAVCTADYNECGFGSVCGCPDGYGYNAALGKCVLELGGVSSAISTPVDATSCAKPAQGICTRDINMCGQPSTCTCEDGFAWNDVAGMCVKVL